MVKEIVLSAPGKLILCGEHAVVYGKKALATAINLRTYLHAIYDGDLNSNIVFILEDIHRTIRLTENDYNDISQFIITQEDYIDELIQTLLRKEDKILESIKLIIFLCKTNFDLKWSNLTNIKVNIKSEIPLSSGLGSSASYSVCIASFLLIVSNKVKIENQNNVFTMTNEDLKLINKYALYIEKFFHGKPSGIDNSVSTFGNYVLFEKGKIVENFESKVSLPVLIVNSCIPKKTLQQVNKVRELHIKHEQIVDSIFYTIDYLVQKFVNILKNQSDNNILQDLNSLIKINQGLLYALNVSNHQLNKIVTLAEESNYSCKITGAGGGGCCFILLFDDNQNISKNYSDLMEKLEKNNFLSFKTRLGCDGIIIEKIANF